MPMIIKFVLVMKMQCVNQGDNIKTLFTLNTNEMKIIQIGILGDA